MPSIFKSALPVALPVALAVAPLLLAAVPPSQLGSAGADCDWESISARGQQQDQAIAPNGSQYPERNVTAQPIAHPGGALVNSEQEMADFARGAAATSQNRWATAIRLLLNNPYTVGRTADSASDSPPAQVQSHCITHLAPEIQPEIQQAASMGKSLFAQADADPMLDEASPMPLPTLETPSEVPAVPLEVPGEESVPAAAPAIEEVDRSPAVNPNNITPTTVVPTPFEGTTLSTLAALPDGNYRYISGEADRRTYATEELLQRGDSVFVLRKEGNRVTGDLLPRIGQSGICVTGLASGNVITGAAYPYEPTDILQNSGDSGETLAPYGNDALKVRRTQRQGNRLYYARATLDLNSFSRINAGAVLPPESCS
ncbi:MAG: hypothetical protein WBB01_04835 [Phormidesmis sp.]